MLINVLVTYTVYLIPVFYPNAIGIGLVPMLFGFGQFIVHGIVTNIKMKTLYNPVLFAVVFLHYPIDIYYIYYIISNNLVRGFDWVIAVLSLVAAMACVNIITYRLLPNRNTKFVFDEVEMKRFNVQGKGDKDEKYFNSIRSYRFKKFNCKQNNIRNIAKRFTRGGIRIFR